MRLPEFLGSRQVRLNCKVGLTRRGDRGRLGETSLPFRAQCVCPDFLLSSRHRNQIIIRVGGDFYAGKIAYGQFAVDIDAAVDVGGVGLGAGD